MDIAQPPQSAVRRNVVTETAGRFSVEPNAGNHFAWIRTQLALQRTFMAGVRTSVSLIGFGFTVAKFFESLQQSGPGAGRMGPEAPRDVGLMLIGAGVISLVVFLWQFHRAVTHLRSDEYAAIAAVGRRPMHISTYITAIVVILVGIAAFGMILFRF
jgi:putative membrane protein